MKKVSLFLSVFLFFICFSSLKGASLKRIYQELLKDFSPLSGFLIDHEDKGWVIDKGSAEGVKKGGLWGVYKTYPAPELIGVLEITQTEKHFSFARLLTQKEKIKLPLAVKRLETLKIALIFSTNSDRSFINLLKNHFPSWKVEILSSFPPPEKKYDFVFFVTQNGIKVYDRNLSLVRTYGGFEWVSLAEVSNPLEIVNCKLLGRLSATILQAGFRDVDNDNFPELVYLTKKGLFVVKIKGGLVAYYIPAEGKPESFSLGPDGWIALNLTGKKSMENEILKISGNMIIPVIRKVNYRLKFCKNVLYGQSSKGIFILQRAGDKVFPVKEIKMPPGFNLMKSIFADLDRDGENEIVSISSENKIVVCKDNQIVWESPFKISQSNLFSPQFLKIEENKKTILLAGKTDFPLDIIANDLPHIPLNYATSQIIALGFKNGFFWKEITPPKQGFITGLGLFKGKLFYVILKGSYPDRTISELYYCEF